jgi:NitT/TauT family transport system substrate-binding protein
MLKRRTALAAPLLLATRARADSMTKVTFGTDWLAEAEHGGFYQALAMGLYKARGLDVTIRMGGPQTNGMAAIATGQVDFQLASGSLAVLNMVQQSIPVVAVAAFFQKDPQVLISHPGTGADTLAQMKGRPILISAGARAGFWQFLKVRFGFTDAQIRPYNFSMAPFLADRQMIQEGLLSSEPFEIQRVSGIKPVVNLLADNGFDGYSDLILTRARTVTDRKDVVRGFVEASAEGWYHYMYRDPTPGNALIRAANPDMTEATIANAIQVMHEHGIVDSGDSLALGIGAMTAARWNHFLAEMAEAKLFPATLDVAHGYTAEFVNKGHGLDIKPR